MSITEIDSRQGEADRAFHYWAQKGVPPLVVRALLPMLVGTAQTQREASGWLAGNATVGNDLSPEGQAAEGQLLNKAEALYHSALHGGDFTGNPPFKPPKGRYGDATESQQNAALDRQTAPGGYPGADGNARRLRVGALEEQMRTKHGSTANVTDSGDVYVTDPNTLRQHKVDHVTLPKSGSRVGLRDTAPTRQSKGLDLSNVAHYKDPDSAADADYWQQGGNTPFFIDD